MLIGFFLGLSAITALAVWGTERIDRPRRRAERLANTTAAQ
jgi:hypothetical protein